MNFSSNFLDRPSLSFDDFASMVEHPGSTIEAKSSKLKDRPSKKLDEKFNFLKRKEGIPQLSNLDKVIFRFARALHHPQIHVYSLILVKFSTDGS